MKNAKIIIVDDDQNILEMLNKVLENYQFDTDCASNGEKALNLIDKNAYDLMLLDINMPGINGFQVIKELRIKNIDLPIIVISARRDEYDTLLGLDIGADDYITKPFNPVVLVAKMKALLRRYNSSMSSDYIVAGPFVYDLKTLKLYKNEIEIPLSGKENVLMKLFMDNPNKTLPKETIYELVWNNNVIDENVIMVYVKKLREKIEDDPNKPVYIKNVRGVGYKFII